jgi:protein-L-isoaspartate(D-aspartate) O-methyltransferase
MRSRALSLAQPNVTSINAAASAARQQKTRIVGLLTPHGASAAPESREHHSGTAIARAQGMIDYIEARHRLVENIAARGIHDPLVLAAIEKVPREVFVPEDQRHRAYEDRPLPIGSGQTISQPYIVALMAQSLEPTGHGRFLEIGAGSGYGAAVLACLCDELYTIERRAILAVSAAKRLHELGFDTVRVRHGDGTLGWPELAPYDAVCVTAAGPQVPRRLLEQLAVGGRLVMPVGPVEDHQQLVRVRRVSATELVREDLGAVTFVPLVGAQGYDGGAPSHT